MDTILEVKDLRKAYKTFFLKDISFKLERNKITGFIGINGSGKTTAIKCILGLSIKDKGTISFLDIVTSKNGTYFRDKIGVVLDECYFYKNLSISEMKSVIAPSYKRWDEDNYKRLINRFDLNINQTISSLSKGMSMKFSIAIALSHHAELIIMDEPTSGLDVKVRQDLLAILSESVKTDGSTVFFSTHLTSDLDKIADQLIMIDQGSIIFNEELSALVNSHKIVKYHNHKKIPEKEKALFLNYDITNDSFIGLTNKTEKLLNTNKEVNLIVPSIEDIMLAYIKEV
jgi:ABC-2 type transport system ATP-binding protein